MERFALLNLVLEEDWPSASCFVSSVMRVLALYAGSALDALTRNSPQLC